MKQTIKVAVVGGTGKSGQYLVQELLKRRIPIKMLVRNRSHLGISDPLAEVVHGNVKDYAAVLALLEGCHVVISTLGLGQPPDEPTVFSQATTNILRAMNALQLRRYIVITGLNVDTPFDSKGIKAKSATEWMYANFPVSTADKQKEYTLLQESPLDWTLVRLPLIVQTDKTAGINISLTDCPGDQISATDLAHFLIAQLDDRQFIRQAPFIVGKAG